MTESILKHGYDKFYPAVKRLLFSAIKSIEIDQPSCYRSLLERFEPYRKDLRKFHLESTVHKSSYSQKRMAEDLKEAGLIYIEGHYIEDIYEADFLIPNKGIIIEMLGKPSHFSQYTTKIDMKSKIKMRHLKKLGWKVLVVISNTDFKLRVKQAVSILENAKDPTCLYLDSSTFKLE